MTPNSLRVCARFLVQGHVQGVSFRVATEDEARRLGLCGWVANRADGDVAVTACGDPQQLDALEKWLWVGPTRARVLEVRRTTAPMESFQGFEVRY